MTQNAISAVILAAGKGTRMKSQLPKVLHKIAWQPMVSHVLQSVYQVQRVERVALVLSEDMDNVRQVAGAVPMPARCALDYVVQKERLGTGHAVKMALPALQGFKGTTLILLGDVPLVQAETIRKLISKTEDGAKVCVLGFYAANPAEYGRMITSASGDLEKIVEYKDASDAERKVNLCNSGIIAVDNEVLPELIGQLKNENAKKEYYLTDIIAIARSKGYACRYEVTEESEVMGVNSREQLAQAEHLLQQRLRKNAMENGVTMMHPESVFLATDTVFGTDVVLHPHVVFGPGVRVGEEVEIRSFCHIEGANIGDHAIIGPFARLRPGSVLEKQVHVGNFVEIKNATLDEGAKANHLSYIGDASVGQRTNIGAGTITCNYDGFRKSETVIGKDCFIGSHTSLVAPVTIGDGVIIGAGSTITEDVEDDAMSLTRTEQKVLPKKAKEYREKRRKGI